MFFKYDKGGFNTDCIEGFKDVTDYVTVTQESAWLRTKIKTPENLLLYEVEIFITGGKHNLYGRDAKRFLDEFLKSEIGGQR